MEEFNKDDQDRRMPSNKLFMIHAFFLILAAFILYRIVYIQFIWEPTPKWNKVFQLEKQSSTIKPERGSIMDCNGKLMAISTPIYKIFMDCTIMKDHYEKMEDPVSRDTLERNWRLKAKALSEELPKVLEEEGKDADYYYNLIITKRDSKKKDDGRRHVHIASNVDHATLLKLKQLPLFKESPYRSGMIVEKEEKRMYPYGALAGRVIGDIRIDPNNPEDEDLVEMINEDGCNIELKGKAILIS